MYACVYRIVLSDDDFKTPIIRQVYIIILTFNRLLNYVFKDVEKQNIPRTQLPGYVYIFLN